VKKEAKSGSVTGNGREEKGRLLGERKSRTKEE
jgi:hypothetical protein